MTDRPSVLFVCVHNAGRSQMAAAYTRELSGGAVQVRSAERPKLLTTDAVQTSDAVITMGCGDACPIFPGKRYEDWQLEVAELLSSLGVDPVEVTA